MCCSIQQPQNCATKLSRQPPKRNQQPMENDDGQATHTTNATNSTTIIQAISAICTLRASQQVTNCNIS